MHFNDNSNQKATEFFRFTHFHFSWLIQKIFHPKGIISLDYFDFRRIISLDYFDFRKIICLDYFDFCRIISLDYFYLML